MLIGGLVYIGSPLVIVPYASEDYFLEDYTV